MTALRYFYVDSVNSKTANLSFQIVKTINAVNYVNATFHKGLLDALITAPAIGDDLNIEVTCADATNVVEFNGTITKITPKGRIYEIEGRANGRQLSETTYNSYHSSTAVQTVAQTIIQSGTGLTYSNPASVTGPDITSFYGMRQDKLSLLKQLSDMSVSGSAQHIFYQDGSDDNTVIWDRFGRNATGITLTVGTAIVAPCEWNESNDEKIKDITIIYSGGSLRHYHTDGAYTKTIHAYHLNNATDALLLADKLLYDYENARILVKAKVRHDYLNSGTYYDVINQTYTITDASAGKTAAGPYTCIQHKINYPGFVDELTFGNVYQDVTTYQKSLERRIQDIERTRPSLYPSYTLRYSDDTEVTTSSETPVERKDFIFANGLPASYRLSWQACSADATEAANTRIYLNGSILGTNHISTGTTWDSIVEDFNVPLVATDELQLYLSTSNTLYLAKARNFRLSYDYSTVRDVSVT